MKLLSFYLYVPAVLFQAIFASSSSNGKETSLKSKESDGSMLKQAVGKLVSKRRLPNTSNKLSMKKNTRVCKRSKSDVVIKEDSSRLLINLLPKELVRIVIGYFDDDNYHFIVSTHNWLLRYTPQIAVDSARAYIITYFEGIKGLSHSLGSARKDERHCIKLGNPQWYNYWQFSSSNDGRYVSFKHSYKTSTDLGEQVKRTTKWLTQGNGLEDGRLKHIPLDGEDFPYGLLSRDGQTLCSCSYGTNAVTRVYQVRKETGRDPAGFIKFELNGAAHGVSGSSNRVIVIHAEQLEVHDISNGASKLVCQIDGTNFGYVCALNEDGSEAAFVIYNDKLRIVEVGKVDGVKADQPAIVTVIVPEAAGSVDRLVYSDEGKLHVHHAGGKVSLFNPLTKELILLEAPEVGQEVIESAISPNADYIAFLQKCNEKDQPFIHTMTVKRKFNNTDWKDLFGYVNLNECAKASAVLNEKANLPQARGALSHSISEPLTRLTAMPVKRGSLCAFDGYLKHRYVLDDDLVIHQKATNSDDDRGSVKLPAAVVRGNPHYLQTNSDGTVFYLATRMNKKRYLYVIDVARKRVYEHHLKHLGSDAVEVRAHLDGKILEVALQDQAVLIFSCKAQRLCLLNKLTEGKRLVGVNQSIGVFEERESAGLTRVSYFDLIKANASLCSLPYRDAEFFALDKNDIYLINAKSIVRFNVKTKETATIKKHYVVRSSHIHNGSIRIVDHAFVYRVLDINTFRQLHEIGLLSFAQQKDKSLHISISCDGRRVMVSQPDVAHIFEIVDPKFIHKMQAIENIRAK